MGAVSKIGWTHATFNPWWGCHKVSPACKNCYAEAFSKRTGNKVWGADAPRRFFGEKHWAEPLKWNRAAEKAGERRRVFCGSMMDVLEMYEDETERGTRIYNTQQDARSRLWDLIESTPWLDWLLLTKRPENAHLLPWAWQREGCPPNVWFGATVENQEYADLRIPHLLKVPARVRFLSCEPLLGPVDLWRWVFDREVAIRRAMAGPAALNREQADSAIAESLNWVIAGGESGHGHREHQLEWSRSLRDQCKAAGVAYFFKQLGERSTQAILSPENAVALGASSSRIHFQLKPRSKGESLDEIPPDLRIREFPQVSP